jgi:hypothetical protein
MEGRENHIYTQKIIFLLMATDKERDDKQLNKQPKFRYNNGKRAESNGAGCQSFGNNWCHN